LVRPREVEATAAAIWRGRWRCRPKEAAAICRRWRQGRLWRRRFRPGGALIDRISGRTRTGAGADGRRALGLAGRGAENGYLRGKPAPSDFRGGARVL
jgi:hypothetical protein